MKMGTVLEGIMTRLGAGPLPLAEVMTPPRGGTRQYTPQANMFQEWMANNSFVPPSSQTGGAPQQGREPPTTNSRPVVRQTVAVPVPEADAARGRAMEAEQRGMTSTGGEAMLQLLKNSGHEGVGSMLTVEGPGPST